MTEHADRLRAVGSAIDAVARCVDEVELALRDCPASADKTRTSRRLNRVAGFLDRASRETDELTGRIRG